MYYYLEDNSHTGKWSGRIQTTISAYKADGKLHEIDRDVAKRWKTGNLRLACVGFENQTSSDSDMPLRVIAYDGMEYRAQLLKKTVDEPDEARKQERYPVITMCCILDMSICGTDRFP